MCRNLAKVSRPLCVRTSSTWIIGERFRKGTIPNDSKRFSGSHERRSVDFVCALVGLEVAVKSLERTGILRRPSG